MSVFARLGLFWALLAMLALPAVVSDQLRKQA